jgi:hypothetical protein
VVDAFDFVLARNKVSPDTVRTLARRTDLLSNYLSQRIIDPVLPTRPGVLKVIKNVPVNS